MTQRIAFLALLLAAIPASHADTPFYTENWANLNNWTVQQGSPIANYYLYNSGAVVAEHSDEA